MSPRLAALLAGVAVAATVALPRSDSGFTSTAKNSGAGFGAASSFYAQTVKDDGAVGYWRLGEANGSLAAADASGGNHPGAYRDYPTLGVTGTSQDSDTAQQSGSVTYGVLPRLVVNDYSVEVWFKSTATDPYVAGFWADAPFMMLGNQNYGQGAGNFGVALNGDGTVIAGTAETNTTISTSPTAYNDGNWHHVVFTRVQSTGTIKLYVDGSQKATATGAGTGTEDDSNVVGLGVNDWRDSEYHHAFNGYLDEVAEYTTALSGTRVSAHYSARNSGYTAAVTADSPAGYWRLNDAASSGRLLATAGGAAATGGIGGGVAHGQAGATGDGDTAMRFTPSLRQAYVPRLVSTTFTIEARFRTTQVNGGTGNWYSSNRIVGADIPGDTTDFGVGIGGDGLLYGGTGSPDTTIASPAGTTYNDGNWHEVAFTRTSATGAIRLYADGALVASGTGGTAALTASSNLYLGADQGYAQLSQVFAGDISDVAQYSAALTQTRLNAHVAAATSSAAYHTAVQADSPVGYWPMNDTTGTTLAALVGGAGNNGYANTGVQRSVSGTTGAGMRFGLPDEQGATVPRLVTDTFSLGCWFRTSSGLAGSYWYNGMPLIQADAGGAVADYGLSMSRDGRVMFGSNSAAAIVQSAAGLNDGNWHHVVLTRNSATGAVVLYIDGAQSATATGPTGSLNAANTTVGLGMNSGGQQALDGTLDEVAVYATILTAAQVANHHVRGT